MDCIFIRSSRLSSWLNWDFGSLPEVVRGVFLLVMIENKTDPIPPVVLTIDLVLVGYSPAGFISVVVVVLLTGDDRGEIFSEGTEVDFSTKADGIKVEA